MALTVGGGPFGHAPAGKINLEVAGEQFLFWDPYRRRMRAWSGGEKVVDSRGGMLLHEHGRLPRCYFPLEDVRMDLLEPNGRTRTSPLTGTVVPWRLRVGDRVVEDAAISHADLPEDAPDMSGRIALLWDAFDEWREEDALARAHIRDPYHRVDALPTSLPLQVRLGGEVVAATERAVVLHETGLPARWYVPAEDVIAELRPSELETSCAYKGTASYWSVEAGGRLHENIAWSYSAPEADAAPAAGHICFFNERVEIEIDGELEPAVWTPWAEEGWWLEAQDLAVEI